MEPELLSLDKTSHTAEADIVNGDRILSGKFKKFKDVTSLCKAYSSLESEFTKRCQTIRKLEGKIEALESLIESAKPEITDFDVSLSKDDSLDESQKLVDNGLIEPLSDKKPFDEPEKPAEIKEKCAEDRNMCVNSPDKPVNAGITEAATFADNHSETKQSDNEGNPLGTIHAFFCEYPEAKNIGDKLAAKLSGTCVTEADLLKAYISVLKDGNADLIKEDTADPYNDLPDFVKQKIIRDYLYGIKSSCTESLLSGGGEIPLMPPKKPKSIAEASLLAKDIIKIK